MKLQEMLDNKIKEYVEYELTMKILDKLSWNEGGVLYSISDQQGIKKTLFGTSLKKNQLNRKSMYYHIFEESRKENLKLIKCEKIECKNIFYENELIGCYIFVVMEQVTPLIEMILEESFCENKLNDNQKKIKLLSAIVDACVCARYVEEKFRDINMFINNEELCVDQNGKTKLLLFDMIKNEIDINNQVEELNIILKKMSKGLNICLNVTPEESGIIAFEQACRQEREELQKIEKQYHVKFEKYMDKAGLGNARAQYNIGYMFENGKGVDRDYESAIVWYEKAAKQKNVEALNNLAHMYQKGHGVKKDYKKAVEYLLMAAKRKDSVAQFNLGLAYQQGKGVKKDVKKALYWYRKSMKSGNDIAERMYAKIVNKK